MKNLNLGERSFSQIKEVDLVTKTEGLSKGVWIAKFEELARAGSCPCREIGFYSVLDGKPMKIVSLGGCAHLDLGKLMKNWLYGWGETRKIVNLV